MFLTKFLTEEQLNFFVLWNSGVVPFCTKDGHDCTTTVAEVAFGRRIVLSWDGFSVVSPAPYLGF